MKGIIATLILLGAVSSCTVHAEVNYLDEMSSAQDIAEIYGIPLPQAQGIYNAMKGYEPEYYDDYSDDRYYRMEEYGVDEQYIQQLMEDANTEIHQSQDYSY